MANSLQLLLLFGLAFYSLSHTNKVIDRCWEKYGNVAAFALRFSHAHAGGTRSGASCASAQRPPSTASVCCTNSLPLTGENGRWSSRIWAKDATDPAASPYRQHGAAAAVAHSLRSDILCTFSHEQSLRPQLGEVRPATTCAAYSLRFLHAHAEDASSGASSASARRPSSCASVCCASSRPAKAALATRAQASSRRAADRCCDVLRLQSSSSSLSCSASTAMRDDIERRMRTVVFAAPALLSEPLPSASHTQPPPTM